MYQRDCCGYVCTTLVRMALSSLTTSSFWWHTREMSCGSAASHRCVGRSRRHPFMILCSYREETIDVSKNAERLFVRQSKRLRCKSAACVVFVSILRANLNAGKR